MNKEKENMQNEFLKRDYIVENIAKEITDDQCRKINNLESYIESELPKGYNVGSFFFYIHTMIDIKLIKSTFDSINIRANEGIEKKGKDAYLRHVKNLIKNAWEDIAGEEF